MTDVATIAARMAGVAERAAGISFSLDYEAKEVSSVMQRVRVLAALGDRRAEDAAPRLYEVHKALVTAGMALHELQGHCIDFTARIRS